MPDITKIEHFTMAEVMRGDADRHPSNRIYIVRHNGVPAYVGKTTIPLIDRLRKHIREGSRIGRALNHAGLTYTQWDVEVWHVDYGLQNAEQNAINQYQPHMNKAK